MFLTTQNDLWHHLGCIETLKTQQKAQNPEKNPKNALKKLLNEIRYTYCSLYAVVVEKLGEASLSVEKALGDPKTSFIVILSHISWYDVCDFHQGIS